MADSDALSERLRGSAGTRVALLADDQAPAVVAIHAVRRAGAVLVPLHGRLPPAELGERLAATRVMTLLHDRAHADLAANLADGRGLRVVDIEAGPAPGGPAASPGIVLETPGAIVHTSGTTARPRGVVLTHGALLASAAAWNGFLGSGPSDHWLSTLPLAHVAGLGMVLRPLLSGARLSLHRSFDARAVREAIEGDGVTLVSLVPTQLVRLLDAGPLRSPTVRAVLVGGGPVSAALVSRALDAGLPVVTTYGLTEAGSGVTALPSGEARRAPGSVGRALPGMRVRVVGQDGADVEPGTVGVVLAAGPSLATAYLDDAPATAATFADGWLRTQDLGRLDEEGRLWVVGRVDDLIIRGGENVSPAEVEAVLATHPGLADVAVVGRPDPVWGAVPVAAVVPRAGHAAPSIEELREFARPLLAAYQVPAASVAVAAIPRTPSGKVVRRAVAALLDPGAPAGHATWHEVTRPDGARLHVDAEGDGPCVVLLHATLSTAAELRGLATRLASACRVLAVDRRSAGASRMPPDDAGGAIDVQTHVEDLVAVLDAFAPEQRALVVGHSFGGCVALELAARCPDRVAGAWVFEPPYLSALPTGSAPDLRALGDRIASVAQEQGSEAAALAFLDTVRGPGTAARLPASARHRLGAEGRSAVADAALLGLEPEGLGRIVAPVVTAVGGRSAGPYVEVAAALAGRIPTHRTVRLPELGHGGPVSKPDVVAHAIIGFARSIGFVGGPPRLEGSR